MAMELLGGRQLKSKVKSLGTMAVRYNHISSTSRVTAIELSLLTNTLRISLAVGQYMWVWRNFYRKAKYAAEKAKFLAEENKSSPLFDGRYRFNLFRHNDDEGSMKIGNGFVQIRNGEVIIEKDNRELKQAQQIYMTLLVVKLMRKEKFLHQ